MKKLLLMTLLGVNIALAQRTVTGTVTDATTGESLAGVAITIKGTTVGAYTTEEGTYRLDVPNNASTLVFTYLTKKTIEEAIGDRSVINVRMEEDVFTTDEVVVTGLGIARQTKALPYAAQSVNAEKLNLIRQTSLNNALAGKVAGVQVRSQASMALNRDATIRIRGAGSLSDKEPLYVVDGTPVNSSEVSLDDVESITVLKGPSATAIYGQRGDAGVVIVTTKKGAKTKGIGIEVNQSTFFDRVYVVPEYQDVYAGGGEADLIQFSWQAGMPEEWKVFEGKSYHDYSDDASWGPKMEGQEYIPWYAWYVGSPDFGKTERLLPQEDNIRDFYETGISTNNNINFNKRGDNYSIRLSFTNQYSKGLIPNSEANKYIVASNITFDLNKHFSLGANINYLDATVRGEFNDGYGNQSSGSFSQWFHRNIDMQKLKELRGLQSPEGILASWNHNNPGAYLSSPLDFYGANYWYNFYTYFDKLDYESNRNRLFGDVNLTYKLNDHFRVTGFVRTNRTNLYAENKVPNILQNSATQTGLFASYGTGQLSGDIVNGNTRPNETNYELLTTYSNIFGDLTVDANLGGNIRRDELRTFNAGTVNGLIVPDLFALSNSVSAFSTSQFRSNKEVRSIYGRGSFGYKELIYVDWSARNDWSSALPPNANSYFYPSLGTSFVFSELTKDFLPVLSFGKIRASWAQVGSDIGPYALALTYSLGQNQFDGNPVTGTPNTLVDPNIKPALSSAYEIGGDLKFFQNRIGIGVTYYNEIKKDEIISVQTTGASGFTSKLINAGEIERSGVEILLEGSPIRTKTLNWDITLNFATNTSKINELAPGIDALIQETGTFGTSSGVRLVHQVGQEWGQLRGGGFKLDESGRRVVDANGFYVAQPNTYFGSVLPDFNGGLFNALTYKNIVFNFNIEFSKGGKYFSLSDHWGTFSGLFERTAATNDNGKNVRDAVADGGGVRVIGATANGEAVDRYVDGFNYFHQFRNRRIAEEHVYDLSFVKLREVSIGYQVPVAKLGVGNILQNANFSFVARNPWLIYAENRDFDPSEISSRYGENGQFPGTRSLGFNIKLGF